MEQKVEAGEDGSTEGKEALPPIDPKVVFGSLQKQLSAIPWASVGALGTGLGIALLVFYFKSIDFVPPDVPAILSASVFVALMAVALFLLVVGGVIAPVWVYRESGLQTDVSAIDRSGHMAARVALPALQFLGVGLFFLFLAFQSWRRCDGFVSVWIWMGGVSTALGVIAWCASEAKRGEFKWKRLALAAWVCLAAPFPLYVLWELFLPSQGATWWHIGAFGLFWLVAVIGTTFLVKLPLWAGAFIVSLMFPMLAFSALTFLGNASQFSTRVAELAGIRLGGANELRVPQSTCQLIASVLGEANPLKPLSCGEGEWGIAHAAVLSNLGSRWLIEVPLSETSQGGPLRLTIPGEGVQFVRPVRQPKTSSCG